MLQPLIILNWKSEINCNVKALNNFWKEVCYPIKLFMILWMFQLQVLICIIWTIYFFLVKVPFLIKQCIYLNIYVILPKHATYINILQRKTLLCYLIILSIFRFKNINKQYKKNKVRLFFRMYSCFQEFFQNLHKSNMTILTNRKIF